MGVPEVLPGLRRGRSDAFFSAPRRRLALQWTRTPATSARGDGPAPAQPSSAKKCGTRSRRRSEDPEGGVQADETASSSRCRRTTPSR